MQEVVFHKHCGILLQVIMLLTVVQLGWQTCIDGDHMQLRFTMQAPAVEYRYGQAGTQRPFSIAQVEACAHAVKFVNSAHCVLH